MASIIYRIYLFFSAVTPAIIYSLVAAFLVFLFSLRIDDSMQTNLIVFFAALGFSAGIRVLKDIWSQWPYAYHSNKFNVACLLALAVLVVADNFFRAYSKFDGQPMSLTANSYIAKFFVIPEVASFLILNIAIIWPLNSIEGQAKDVAWVTMLVMSVISSSILLMNAKATPINPMAGALFSKIWNVEKIDISGVDLSSPKQYQVWQFSFKGWLLMIVVSLMTLGTVFMESGLTHWFLPFLISAECLWVAVYLYLRIKVLKSTLAKVAVFYRKHNSYYQAGQFSNERQLPAELAPL